jgi:hypothetical protein
MNTSKDAVRIAPTEIRLYQASESSARYISDGFVKIQNGI